MRNLPLLPVLAFSMLLRQIPANLKGQCFQGYLRELVPIPPGMGTLP